MHFLVRRFIPNYHQTDDPWVRTQYGVLSGIVGIFLNLFLFISKMIAGLLSHSIAIVADAFNNLSDAGSSIITLIGFRLAGNEADENHPFGHGRIEYLTGLFVSILILIVGFTLGKESITKILHPEPTIFSFPTVVILFLSIGVKLYMYFYNRSFAKTISSVALSSTALDSRGDAITTFAVLLSQIFAAVTNITVDGPVGLFVAVYIFISGVRSCLDTIGPLLGQEPDQELVASIQNTVMSYKNVLGYHDLLIHDYGPGRRMMSLHIEVPESMSLRAAHELADSIEMRLEGQYHIQTVIHVDPYDQNDPELAQIADFLQKKLSAQSEDLHFHDLHLVSERNQIKVIFDIVIPYSSNIDEAKLLQSLSDDIRSLSPGYRPIITVDHSAASQDTITRAFP